MCVKSFQGRICVAILCAICDQVRSFVVSRGGCKESWDKSTRLLRSSPNASRSVEESKQEHDVHESAEPCGALSTGQES